MKKRLLIIDVDLLIQNGLSMLVDRNIFSVSTTSSIENAINLINHDQVDCTIINWFSPHLCESAWELARMIRQSSQKGLDSKIIFTMERPTLQALRLSEILQPISIVSLPKTKNAFSDAISNALENHKKLEHPRMRKTIDTLDAVNRACQDTLMKKFSYEDIINLLKAENLPTKCQVKLLRLANYICPFDLWVVTKLIDSNCLTSSEVTDIIRCFYLTTPKTSNSYRLNMSKLNNFYKQRNINKKHSNYKVT